MYNEVLRVLSLTCEHGDASPATNASTIHALDGSYNVFIIDTSFLRFVEFVGEDVEHELTVAFSVDMAMCLVVQEFSETGCIDEITIVGKANA